MHDDRHRYTQKECVELGGELVDWGQVLRFVDEDLFYEAAVWAGYGATPQAMLDAYLPLHERKYGAPFAYGAR